MQKDPKSDTSSMALFSRTPKKGDSSRDSSSSSGASENSPSGGFGFFSRLMGSSSPRAVPGGLRANSYSISSAENISISSVDSGSTDNTRGASISTTKSEQKADTIVSEPAVASTSTEASPAAKKDYRTSRFEVILSAENIDESELRDLSWRGVPAKFRAQAWQVMLGYAPTNKSRRSVAIAKKRKEYAEAISVHFDAHGSTDRPAHDVSILSQIQKDLPRTCPDILFFHQKEVQAMMERILYIWSIRHPASGYVQGMNDVLIPLLIVAFQPFAPADKVSIVNSIDVLKIDVAHLPAENLMRIEADAFWAFSKLLDGVQDHYTHSQPGVQRMILRLEDLMGRHCPMLSEHFAQEGVHYMQFAFRWMNCFLLRELPLPCVMRLWDTYFAEQRAGFETFHVNLCAVLLKTFESQLMEMSFQGMVMFLQDMPTQAWGEQDMDEMLSQAYILSALYDGSTHLG